MALQEQWESYASRRSVGTDATAQFLQALVLERVHRFGGAVLVTRFDDVAAIHRDATQYGSRAGLGTVAANIQASLRGKDRQEFDELQRFRTLLMAREDGERHHRLRSIAHRAFTPRRIAVLKLDIETFMRELVERVDPSGALDISEIAYRLPLRVIGDLLAVPVEDQEQMHEWSQQFAQGASGTAPDPPTVRASLQAIEQFKAYSEGLLQRWRQAREGSELVEALLAGDEASRLTSLELAGTFVQLMVAGQETTSRLISSGVHELLRNPEQWALLCADPEGLASNATEELLRFVSPLPFQARVPSSDVTIAGVEVKAGTTVFPILAAANRDPDVFPDPGKLDIRRENARQHLAFGVGPHFCLGASLARTEGTVAFSTLARRFPTMRLSGTAEGWTSKLGVPESHRLEVLV